VLLHASWEDVVFLHFLVEPRELRRRLPDPLRLDLPLGAAWLTLTALRCRGPAPLPPRLLRGVPTYAQCSLRTYVEHDGERGSFVFDQAVSSATVAAAGRVLGIHQRVGAVRVRRREQPDELIEPIEIDLDDPARGLFREQAVHGMHARVRASGATVTAHRDRVADALLERYLVFDGDPPRRTSISHAPWVVQSLEIESLDTGDLLPPGAHLAATHFGTPRVVATSMPHAMHGIAPALTAEPA
jgi:uncharacterized protein YqjF (DUF2071 family)